MSDRFYPAAIAPFPFEPDRRRFEIIGTVDKGEGIISLVPFKKGEVVFTFTGETLPYQNLYTLQIAPGRYLYDPYFMGKVLHSCDPNMRCDMQTLTFTARKDIAPNTSLTMDYDTTEEVLFRPFDCCCRSPLCRGYICGYGSEAQSRIGLLSDLPQKAEAQAG